DGAARPGRRHDARPRNTRPGHHDAREDCERPLDHRCNSRTRMPCAARITRYHGCVPRTSAGLRTGVRSPYPTPDGLSAERAIPRCLATEPSTPTLPDVRSHRNGVAVTTPAAAGPAQPHRPPPAPPTRIVPAMAGRADWLPFLRCDPEALACRELHRVRCDPG